MRSDRAPKRAGRFSKSPLLALATRRADVGTQVDKRGRERALDTPPTMLVRHGAPNDARIDDAWTMSIFLSSIGTHLLD